jgi:hypothetical protein
MTTKESETEETKKSLAEVIGDAINPSAGEPKAAEAATPAAAEKKEDEAATPVKEEAPKEATKETKAAEEVESKDFEIKTDELSQEDSEKVEKSMDDKEKKEKKESEDEEKEKKAPPSGLIKIKEILTNTATNELY